MSGRPSFSLEFFPPKDLAGEERLWAALDELALFAPDFVSVTYGAGGSARDRTIKITREITSRTGLKTVAHITCVGATESELVATLESYQDSGINSVLALRGDPEGGPAAPWIPTPGGFDHADQLVTLARSMGFEVGVAAFPDGHPASVNSAQDIEVLLEKERRGATSATTQFFFEIQSYLELRERLTERGSRLPLIAGILPITNFRQLQRMAELGGSKIPDEIQHRVESAKGDPAVLKQVGIEIATELASDLIQAGAPGLHFYTMNSSTSTIEVVKRLGLR